MNKYQKKEVQLTNKIFKMTDRTMYFRTWRSIRFYVRCVLNGREQVFLEWALKSPRIMAVHKMRKERREYIREVD